MGNKTKKIFIMFIVIGIILILIGAGLTLKKLMDEESDMLNVADDPSYYRIVFNLNGATSIEHKFMRCPV